MSEILHTIAREPVVIIILSVLAALLISLVIKSIVILCHGYPPPGTYTADDDEEEKFINTLTVRHLDGGDTQLAESEETLWSALAIILFLRKNAAKSGQHVDLEKITMPNGVEDEIHVTVRDTGALPVSKTTLAGTDQLITDLMRLAEMY